MHGCGRHFKDLIAVHQPCSASSFDFHLQQFYRAQAAAVLVKIPELDVETRRLLVGELFLCVRSFFTSSKHDSLT